MTNTSFLTALYVVVTPFVAWAAPAGRRHGWCGLAVLLSVIGTWLLGGGTLAAFSKGDTLVALSAIFWAVHVVITGKAALYARPIGFTVAQFAVVGILGVAGAAMSETVSFEGLNMRRSTSLLSACSRRL